MNFRKNITTLTKLKDGQLLKVDSDWNLILNNGYLQCFPLSETIMTSIEKSFNHYFLLAELNEHVENNQNIDYPDLYSALNGLIILSSTLISKNIYSSLNLKYNKLLNLYFNLNESMKECCDKYPKFKKQINPKFQFVQLENDSDGTQYIYVECEKSDKSEESEESIRIPFYQYMALIVWDTIGNLYQTSKWNLKCCYNDFIKFISSKYYVIIYHSKKNNLINENNKQNDEIEDNVKTNE